MINSELARDFFEDVATELKLKVSHVPKEVYATGRLNDTDCYTFYININKGPTSVVLIEKGLDLIQDKYVSGEVVIEGLDVLIVISSR